MEKRYFGLDVHQMYSVAAAVDANQQIIVKPRKIDSSDLEAWASKTLTPNDVVVIEAMSGCWVMYDMLSQYAGKVIVAHPGHIKMIGASFVKTDNRDVLVLARLLAANLVPEVWAPPPVVRELRALVRHRQRLVEMRATAKCRIRGILQLYRLIGPSGMTAYDPAFWDGLDVPASARLRAKHAIADIELLTCQIKEAEVALTQESSREPWVQDVPFLLQLPGIGLIIAMTMLAAIGDIRRFPSAKQLVGYAGLGARIHSSGKTHQTGGITKQGRRELRYVAIEGAWNAIKYSPLWKERFERLAARIGRRKAAAAIARKLLVIIWNVLTKRAADRDADPNTVAKSMMLWGQRNRLATSLGLKPAQFTRRKLDQLGLGADLEQVTFCTRTYPLPPAEG
jgi:transposase